MQNRVGQVWNKFRQTGKMNFGRNLDNLTMNSTRLFLRQVPRTPDPKVGHEPHNEYPRDKANIPCL